MFKSGTGTVSDPEFMLATTTRATALAWASSLYEARDSSTANKFTSEKLFSHWEQAFITLMYEAPARYTGKQLVLMNMLIEKLALDTAERMAKKK